MEKYFCFKKWKSCFQKWFSIGSLEIGHLECVWFFSFFLKKTFFHLFVKSNLLLEFKLFVFLFFHNLLWIFSWIESKLSYFQILNCLFFYSLFLWVIINFLLNRKNKNIWPFLNRKSNILVFLYFLILNRN